MSKQNPDAKGNFKECIQCMEVKAIEEFRKYYKGKGYYKYCKLCESMNNKFLYMVKNELHTTSVEHNKVYEAFCKIYAALIDENPKTLPSAIREHLSTKGLIKEPTTTKSYLEQCNKYLINMQNKEKVKHEKIKQQIETKKEELQAWIDTDFNTYPDPATGKPYTPERLDDIYEELRTKFRPITGYNQTSNTPIYDNTYKDLLDKLVDKICDYEDNYDY